MQRSVIVAVAGVAMVLAGLGCARDLARASSGVIGCAPEDIAIDDVSVGWSETSWAASCGGTTFRCAGERSPWCAPSMTPQAEPRPDREAAPAAAVSPRAPARAPSPEPSPPKAEPAAAEPPTDATPEPGADAPAPGHPIPEGFTDAPH